MIAIPLWVFITLLVLSGIGLILLSAIFVAVVWGEDDTDLHLP